MRTRVIVAGTCMVIAAASISGPLIAAPVTSQELRATTSNARIVSTMRRLDHFQNRARYNNDSRFYVSRDGQRFAQIQQSGATRLNR